MTSATAAVTRAVVGSGVRICFTPCHNQPVRLEDAGQRAGAEVIACRFCKRGYAVTFPTVPLDAQQLAVWRPIDDV